LPSLQFDPDTERKIFRLGLAGAGSVLFYIAYTLATSAPLVNAPGNLLLLLLAGAGGFFLLACAAFSNPPDWSRWLILAAYLGEVLIGSSLWAQTSNAPDHVLVDPGLYTELAGQFLLRGQNPYEWDLGGIYVYTPNAAGGTPRLNGAPESPHPYPALSFLLVAPLQALGLPGVFTLSTLAHVAALALLFLAAPRAVQPLVLLPIAVAGNFTFLTSIGSFDIVWVAMLVAMIVLWRRPTLRAVLYGLAISFKQSPWLVAPFLLLRLWREERRIAPLKFALISAATFLLVNAPFILWNPRAWLLGATEPLQDSLTVLSHGGLSTLTQFGLFYLPKSYFLLALLTVLALALFCYWRHYDFLRDALWAMPGLFMWFSYRSLQGYWLYWAFPILAAILTRQPPASTPNRTPGWGPTLATFSVAAATLVGGAVFLGTSHAPVQLRLHPPLFTTVGRVTHLTVDVTNAGDHALTPRFSIQSRSTTWNPLLWNIDDGPRALAPGQSATYQLSATSEERTFFGHESAQLVVTDAGADYSLRGVLTLEADRSFLWPAAIPNPSFRFWDKYLNEPLLWSLLSGSAAMIEKDGRDALALNGLRATLECRVVFPEEPFSLWLYSENSTAAYGLEVDDGQHRLWLLFGSQAYAGPVDDGVMVVNQIIPSGEWTRQTIDLPAVYAQAGLQLPPLQHTTHRGLEGDLRLIHLRLLLVSEAPATAYFGEIEQ
jgi:hypothetical protein